MAATSSPYRVRTKARSKTAADGHDAHAMVVLPTRAWGTTMMQLSSRRIRYTWSRWDGSGCEATTTSASRH